MGKIKNIIRINENDFNLLCLDPSLQCTGIAILKVSNFLNENIKFELLDYGYIDTHGMEEGDSLLSINKIVNVFIKQYNPKYASVESPFVGNNRQTIQRLAEVHGLLKFICKSNNICYKYYSVMTAKKMTLDGHITLKKEDGTRKTGDDLKKEVADKVIKIFGVDKFIKHYTNDVTDAISLGICFIEMKGLTTDEVEYLKEIDKKEKNKVNKVNKNNKINKKESKIPRKTKNKTKEE